MARAPAAGRGMRARGAFHIQRSVVFALYLRELKARFGSQRLGYFWAIGEPAAHLAVLLTVMTVMGRRTVAGLSIPLFFGSGLIPYFFLFRHVLDRSIESVSSNQSLFIYRYVTPLDTVLARVLVELVTFFGGALLLLSVGFFLGLEVVPLNPVEVLFAWGLLFFFSVGIGIIFMVISADVPEAKKILHILSRPLYFISGVLFPLSIVPKPYRPYLLWNPVLHAIELGREHFFGMPHVEGVSWGYLVSVDLVLLVLGLALYRVRRWELIEIDD